MTPRCICPSLLLLVIALWPGTLLAQTPLAGDTLWQNPLDTPADFASGEGAGDRAQLPGERVALRISRADGEGSTLRTFELPAERLRGRWITLEADVQAQAVSDKPLDWNGIKVMLKIEAAEETSWPQIPMPVGTFELSSHASRILVPDDAQTITLFLGLERVSGTVWFDNLRVTLAKRRAEAPPAPRDQPIFKGHDLPALRGVMVHPRVTRADLQHLATEWGGNVIRYQLLHMPRAEDVGDLDVYDEWLDGELDYLDQVVAWSDAFGIKVVVDLHSPPGGPLSGNGTIHSTGPFWTRPDAQQHFIKAWRQIARHYKGNSTVWGFDLLNEPDDRSVTPECDDWQTLAAKAGHAIREVDPDRTLIVEPPRGEGGPGFRGFVPLDLPRVVYSFHMYSPFIYTHQPREGSPITYPGEIDGQKWDKAALLEYMQPAIDFADRYRVHLYIGEFSAARWAPGSEQYLADLTSLFEEHGWDWTYHAYRESHYWDVEIPAAGEPGRRVEQPTPRQRVLRKWMEQNVPAK